MFYKKLLSLFLVLSFNCIFSMESLNLIDSQINNNVVPQGLKEKLEKGDSKEVKDELKSIVNLLNETCPRGYAFQLRTKLYKMISSHIQLEELR